MKRHFIWLILYISVVLLSFILPPQLMKWTDQQTVGHSYVQKSEEIALVSQVSLSLTEKIALFQRQTANTLWVSKGKNYDQESVQVKIREELQKLCELGVLEIDAGEIDFYATEGGFVVDTADSMQTMNIWTIYACEREKLYELLFVLDDETGKIIQIQQSYEPAKQYKVSDSKKTEVMTKEAVVEDSEVTSAQMEKIGKAWANYLELPLVEVYHKAVASMDFETEMEKEIQALIANGIEEVEAYYKIYEAWGYDEEYMKRHLMCVVEDNEGIATYFITKDVGNIILSIDFLRNEM